MSPSTLRAGVAYRFSGGIVDSRGSTRIIDQSFDRSDAGGQGNVQFHEFPPLSDESRNMSATSSAGPGYLSASSHADFTKPWLGGGNFNESLSGGAFAGVTWDDVFIGGPPGTISTKFFVHLSGVLITEASIEANSSSNVQLSFYYNNDNVGGGLYGLSEYAGNLTVTESGPLVGFSGNDVITGPTIVVPTNTPLKIGIGMSVYAAVGAPYSVLSNSASNADFSHTLTLATDRPVFDLPPGYTANSAQAGIVNNFFVKPCPGDLNGDRQVDDADFSIFVVGYNILDCADPAMAPGCPADLDHNAVVDDADFSTFVVAYDALVCP